MTAKKSYLFEICAICRNNGTYDLIWDGVEDVPETMVTENVTINTQDNKCEHLEAIPAMITYLVEIGEYLHAVNPGMEVIDLSQPREDLMIKPRKRAKKRKTYFHDKLKDKIRQAISRELVDVSKHKYDVVNEVSKYMLEVNFDDRTKYAGEIEVYCAET